MGITVATTENKPMVPVVDNEKLIESPVLRIIGITYDKLDGTTVATLNVTLVELTRVTLTVAVALNTSSAIMEAG